MSACRLQAQAASSLVINYTRRMLGESAQQQLIVHTSIMLNVHQCQHFMQPIVIRRRGGMEIIINNFIHTSDFESRSPTAEFPPVRLLCKKSIANWRMLSPSSFSNIFDDIHNFSDSFRRIDTIETTFFHDSEGDSKKFYLTFHQKSSVFIIFYRYKLTDTKQRLLPSLLLHSCQFVRAQRQGELQQHKA